MPPQVAARACNNRCITCRIWHRNLLHTVYGIIFSYYSIFWGARYTTIIGSAIEHLAISTVIIYIRTMIAMIPMIANRTIIMRSRLVAIGVVRCCNGSRCGQVIIVVAIKIVTIQFGASIRTGKRLSH